MTLNPDVRTNPGVTIKLDVTINTAEVKPRPQKPNDAIADNGEMQDSQPKSSEASPEHAVVFGAPAEVRHVMVAATDPAPRPPTPSPAKRERRWGRRRKPTAVDAPIESPTRDESPKRDQEPEIVRFPEIVKF